MKIKIKNLVIFGIFAVLVLIGYTVLNARAPVLIVTDLSFVLLYGEKRLRSETIVSSITLFRRIRAIPVTDDAGEDIVLAAITETSRRPYCVLFPLRFARAAREYREQNPLIPAVILEGRHAEGTNPAAFAIGNNTEDYYMYKTDISADFYRAGLAAAILDREKGGRIAVFMEPSIQTQVREALLKALNEHENPLQVSFFTSFGQYNAIDNLSCVVISGTAGEYMDRHKDVPIIYFTWMDPAFIPVDAVLVFNDSPWAQAVQAVRMVESGMTKGQILSKIVVLRGKDIDKNTLQKLNKI